MKKTVCFVLSLMMLLCLLPVNTFAYTEYTGFNIVFDEIEGAKINDTEIRVFASVDDGELVDRTNEFTMEGIEWYKYLPEPEAGKDAEDYDYVDEELMVYGMLATDDDVFEHNRYSYFLRIPRLYADEEDTFYRNVMINGVDVDEMNGTCYNAGNEFAIKTITNGGSGLSEWAQGYIAQADSMGLIPECLVGQDLTKEITRKEFAAVAVKLYESLSDTAAMPAEENPFVDCDDAEVSKAVNIGITNGTSADKFSPDVVLNREQLATMLTRVYKKFALAEWTLATDGDFAEQFNSMFTRPEAFADDDVISDFAKDSVYFMKAMNIIDGVGNNMFAPQHGTTAIEAADYGLATREQALKIAVCMVNNLK